MNHLPRLALVLVPCLALLPSCILLDAEVEIEEACGVRRSIEVEGVPADTDAFAEPMLVDLGSALHDALAGFEGLDVDVEFTRAIISATSGVDGLDFVEAVDLGLIIGTADGGETEESMFTCAGDCVGEDHAITLPAAVPTAASTYLAAPSLTLALDVRGAMPTRTWSFDVSVCAKGKVRLQLEP